MEVLRSRVTWSDCHCVNTVGKSKQDKGRKGAEKHCHSKKRGWWLGVGRWQKTEKSG